MTATPIEQMAFLPSGANTPRPLSVWASDLYYNVKDFNALGVGTDDTVNIQKCLDTAFGGPTAINGITAVHGKTNSMLNAAVYFPAGQYLANNLTINGMYGGKIFGSGANTSLQYNGPGGTGPGHSLLRINGMENSSITDMALVAGDVSLDMDYDNTDGGAWGVSLGNNRLDGLAISNSRIGLRLAFSGIGGAANYLGVGAGNCTYGIQIVGAQAYSNICPGGGGSGCLAAAVWVQGGSMMVYNANLSQRVANTVDIIWDSPLTFVSTSGRSESAQFLKITNGRAIIMGMNFQNAGGPAPNRFMEVLSPAEVVLDGCGFEPTCKIIGNGTIYVRGGTVIGSQLQGGGFTGKVREWITSTPVTFANLPPGMEGCEASITDNNTATWGAAATGGGSGANAHALVRHNGTIWTVVGV